MFAKLKQFQEEREEGFTLIELLVVILIIGILSAIAIPAFLNQRKSAVDSSVQSDVSNAAKQIETAIVKGGATEKLLTSGTAGVGDLKINTADIKLSDGTKLVISGSTFNYKIVGTNAGGDRGNTAEGFTYVSSAGGMQKTGATAVTVPTSTAITLQG